MGAWLGGCGSGMTAGGGGGDPTDGMLGRMSGIGAAGAPAAGVESEFPCNVKAGRAGVALVLTGGRVGARTSSFPPLPSSTALSLLTSTRRVPGATSWPMTNARGGLPSTASTAAESLPAANRPNA